MIPYYGRAVAFLLLNILQTIYHIMMKLQISPYCKQYGGLFLPIKIMSPLEVVTPNSTRKLIFSLSVKHVIIYISVLSQALTHFCLCCILNSVLSNWFISCCNATIFIASWLLIDLTDFIIPVVVYDISGHWNQTYGITKWHIESWTKSLALIFWNVFSWPKISI